MYNNEPSAFSEKLHERILSRSPHSVIFPFYHAISDQYCPHLRNLYRVHGLAQFEKDLDQLLNFMTPLSVDDAIQEFRKKPSSKPSFHLSFDDGLREAKEVIAPILLKKGIPATFFITSGFTNNATLFHRHKVSLIVEMLKTHNSPAVLTKLGSILNTRKNDSTSLQKAVKNINYRTAPFLDEIAEILDINFADFLKKEQPYLNATEVKELANNGFSIGLHSLNHPEFHLLNESEMNFQITESGRKLYELTGLESKLFSYPFTDSGIPDHFIRNVIEQYKITTFGTAGIKDDAIEGHFQRIAMDARPSKSAIQLVTNEILRYKVKVLIGRQKVKR
jgi:peptidoglycan/xylan/chitin deacetylase (PgdA/CDA1 family)